MGVLMQGVGLGRGFGVWVRVVCAGCGCGVWVRGVSAGVEGERGDGGCSEGREKEV